MDWRLVPTSDYRVPHGVPLADLTAELTELLGHPEPARRDVAIAVLTTWISRGVYDDLLPGLGDGIAAGLTIPRKAPAYDGVHRRVASAMVLGRCIARDTEHPLVPPARILDWGDRIATWLLAEKDLRAHAGDRGWVQAIARGADALSELARSPRVGPAELSAILDVIGERVMANVPAPWTGFEADRLAHAAVQVLRRDRLSIDEVEDWAEKLGQRALGHCAGATAPDHGGANADAFLRSLYLVLVLGPRPPAIRGDLVLTLVNFLRELHPDLLA
ncbi:DUF2785 domain-containing protein [Nocardioides montaniterrae]